MDLDSPADLQARVAAAVHLLQSDIRWKPGKHPEVSGFEHLDLLLGRNALAAHDDRLNMAEKEQLAAADQRLLEQVAAF